MLTISWDISLIKSLEIPVNRSNIFLLYFYDAYDVTLGEKSWAQVWLIQAEQRLL